MNFSGEEWIGVDRLDWPKRKDFIENILEEDKDQTLLSRIDIIKCTWEKGGVNFPNPLSPHQWWLYMLD